MHIEKLFLSGVAAVSLAASVCGKEKTTDYLFATFLGDGGPAGQ